MNRQDKYYKYIAETVKMNHLYEAEHIFLNKSKVSVIKWPNSSDYNYCGSFGKFRGCSMPTLRLSQFAAPPEQNPAEHKLGSINH